MSSQQDANAISSLLEAQHLYSSPLYHERSLEYIQPIASGSYNSFIEFNLATLKGRFIDYNRAFVQIPFTITPGLGTFATTPFPALAFKSSFLSMVSGIYVKDGRNTALVDDRNSGAFANHIRLCMESDADFTITRAQQIGFSMDKGARGNRGLSTTAQIQFPNISKYSAVPAAGAAATPNSNGDNSAYSAGFAERMNYLRDSTFTAGGVVISQPSGAVGDYTTGVSGIFNLPLRYLHSFFQKLDFAITGCELTIQIMLNTAVNSAGFCPVSLGSMSIAGGLNTPDSGDVALVGGVAQPSNIKIGITVGEIPRLYYHSVEFNSSDGKRALEQLSKGYMKTIRYQQYDLITSVQYQNQVANSAFTHTITTSVLAPKRVFALCYPAGVLNTSSWPSVLCTGQRGLGNLQLLINNKPLFRAPLDTLGEQYAMLQSAMGSSSDDDESRSLISYTDFARTNRLICLDLTRLSSIVPDPNVPFSLILSGKIVAPDLTDVVYIVEREVEVKMSFGAGRDTAVSISAATLV